MRSEETVVYLPPMTNCFDQWIALREIYERYGNRRFHGRVRCAIRIASDRLGPEYHLVDQGLGRA